MRLRLDRRQALAAVGIALSVVFVSLFAGFAEWIYWAIREGTIQGGTGHLVVASADQASVQSALERSGYAGRVAAVTRTAEFSALASSGDRSVPVMVRAIEPAHESVLSPALAFVAGGNLQGAGRESAAIGRGVATALGAQTGTVLALLVASDDGRIRGSDAAVAGVFTTQVKAIDDTRIRVPIALARTLVPRGLDERITIVLGDTRDTPAVAAALRAGLGSGATVSTWEDDADNYRKTRALLGRQIGLVQGILALVMVLAVGNVMVMGVIARTREIGTMMALGRTRQAVLRAFVREGALLGLLGGLAGAVAAVVLAQAISAVGIPMPPPPGRNAGYSAGIMLTPAILLEGFVLAVATATAASLLPAWRASRMVIVDALRVGR